MNIAPAIYFFMHHGSQLAGMAGSGSKDGARKWLSLAYALTPWLIKHYPHVNEQRLWEDLLDTMENTLTEQQAGAHWPGYPDQTQR